MESGVISLSKKEGIRLNCLRSRLKARVPTRTISQALFKLEDSLIYLTYFPGRTGIGC